MTLIRDLVYAPEHGARGLLDVHQPEVSPAPVVVVYHGGGLVALRKERMDGLCAGLCRAGFGVVNAAYRLLGDAPFPAPVEDALRAAQWVVETDHEALSGLDRSRLAVLGASAGGYLAVAVGCLLGAPTVRGIVDISGPVTPRPQAAGLTSRLAAAPVDLVTAAAPPVLTVHSRNDELVPPAQAELLLARYAAVGARAEAYWFDGPGEQHGIWRTEGPPPLLFGDLEQGIVTFLRDVLR